MLPALPRPKCAAEPITGPADYLLCADGKVIGVIEAKSEGRAITGAETQSERVAAAAHPVL